MIHTRVCEALGIEIPIMLAGMAGSSSAPLVAAVSNAGGLGTFGLGRLSPDQVSESIAAVRRLSDKPFAVNFLLFMCDDTALEVALQAKPAVVAFAWPTPEQDLGSYFERARRAGAKAIFVGTEVAECRRAAEAGADLIVAQGTEAGGHPGWMASLPLVPMVVDAVRPLPVVAAGGIADGRGMAAALALGAEGVSIGTRFLATEESPLPMGFKEAIVNSDGHDTVLTEIPDLASGTVWPGAMARALRNRFIERWTGREWALRKNQKKAAEGLAAAQESGDAEEGRLLMGQDAGLIDSVLPAVEVVRRMAAEAEEILAERLPAYVRQGPR